MPTIQAVLDSIEAAAPRAWQEEWDNAGLQVGSGDLSRRECTGVVVTLDVTEETVREAAETGANLILSHHPLLFRGLKVINEATPATRMVISALQQDIVIYAAHTNIDAAPGGVNWRLAEMLGLRNIRPLVPAEPENVGPGCIGELEKPVAVEDMLALIARTIRIPCLRHNEITVKTVSKVALCGGNGTEFIGEALRQGADLFLTADLKYHYFQEGDGRMLIVDGGHYETEVQVLDVFCELISKKFPNFAVRRARTPSNPVRYYLA